MSTDNNLRRFVAVKAATRLVADAIAAAGNVQADSDDWRFFHGVEAAARHVLHPEMAAVRDGSDWLAAEPAAFREGFLKASTLLAIAASAADPPTSVPLPQPSPR